MDEQSLCCRRLEKAWGVVIAETDRKEIASVDAIASRDGTIVFAMEVKGRKFDLAKLREYGSYLITFDKLLGLKALASGLRVPGLVVVSLKGDGNIAYWKVFDKAGNFLVPFESKYSPTQATCNGGEANRYNAYLGLGEMKLLKTPKLAKTWCAACGTFGDHGSGTCPTITH